MVPLRENIVLASELCVNADYEGDIQDYGDRVHINSLTRPTVKEYSRNMEIVPDLLETEDQILAIDHGRFFAFIVDDLDRVQVRNGNGLMQQAMYESTFELVRAADTYVGAKMLAGALPENKVTIDLATDDLFVKLVEYGQALDEADVPPIGRYAAVSPAVKAGLLKHDRFIASSYGSAEPIQNGIFGSIAGFTVAVTTHLPTNVQMICGSPIATTYGDQIAKLEAVRSTTKFGDIIRGLHVAGAKVIRPEGLIIASTV